MGNFKTFLHRVILVTDLSYSPSSKQPTIIDNKLLNNEPTFWTFYGSQVLS